MDALQLHLVQSELIEKLVEKNGAMVEAIKRKDGSPSFKYWQDEIQVLHNHLEMYHYAEKLLKARRGNASGGTL